MSGKLISLLSRAGAHPTLGGVPSLAKYPGGRKTSVWMAVSPQPLQTQTLIHKPPIQDLLVGTAQAEAVGPRPDGRSEDCHEFLMRVTFLRLFRHRPRVLPFQISASVDGGAPAQLGCDLSVRAVTVEGFTLVFTPALGSPRSRVEFGWVAAGAVLPEPQDSFGVFALPPRSPCIEFPLGEKIP